jgi:hypothetical protein
MLLDRAVFKSSAMTLAIVRWWLGTQKAGSGVDLRHWLGI